MGVKISALPAVTNALLTDFFAVVQGGVTSKETLNQVQTLFQTNFTSVFLPLAGGTMAGNINMDGHVISNGSLGATFDLGNPIAGDIGNCTNAQVAGGGTGVASFTPYAVICGGVGPANNLQDVGSVGTAGQVLTSAGAGALPSWQNASGVVAGSDKNLQFNQSGSFGAAAGISYDYTNGNMFLNPGNSATMSGSGNFFWDIGSNVLGGSANVSLGNSNALDPSSSNVYAMGEGCTAGPDTTNSVLIGSAYNGGGNETVLLGFNVNNISTGGSNFGAGTTISFQDASSNNIAIGTSVNNVVGGSSTLIGNSITSNAAGVVAIGNNLTANAAGTVIGFSATLNNAGSFVACDTNGTAGDTLGDQFFVSFSNGYAFNCVQGLALNIDINGNVENGFGICDKSKLIVAPTTGSTVTLATTNALTIINPAGTLAALTINMPAAPVDGQKQTVSFTQIITALTLSGNGNTLVGTGNLTSATEGQSFTLIYDLATTSWYPG